MHEMQFKIYAWQIFCWNVNVCTYFIEFKFSNQNHLNKAWKASIRLFKYSTTPTKPFLSIFVSPTFHSDPPFKLKLYLTFCPRENREENHLVTWDKLTKCQDFLVMHTTRNEGGDLIAEQEKGSKKITQHEARKMRMSQ